MSDHGDVPGPDACLVLAEGLLADDEPWVVCRPVRDGSGAIIDFEYVLANAAAEASVGIGPMAGVRLLELVPEARETSFASFREALESGTRQTRVIPSVVRADRPWAPGWTTLDVRPSGDAVVAHWRDATVEHGNAVAAQHSEARLLALLENAGEVIYVLASDGASALYQSPSLRRVLGRDRSDPGLTTRIHPDDRGEVEQALAALIASGEGAMVELEVRAQHSEGHWLWVHVRASNRVDDPNVGGIVVNLWDVTRQHELADQLREQALHDPLTGLPNRRLIDAGLERALARAGRSPGTVGLVLCDVDRFKDVNDALGHPAGDELLAQVAERLRALVRPSDTVGRLGGDEFVVVCEDLHEPDELVTVTGRLQRDLRGVYRVADQDLPITVTVGGSCATASTTATQLLSEADTALYEAKRAGRDGSQVFDQHLHRRNRDRARRQQALRVGVEHGQLQLHYQPKVDLRSGAVVGAEALVRWDHPTDGLLLPDEFLPLAQDTALVVDLGTWVMRRAMLDAARWDRSGGPTTDGAVPLVSINVCGRHLAHPALLDQLDRGLDLSGLAPSQVEIEITETVLLDDLEKTARILSAIRGRGLRVALDDFGTGYSSLTWLQRLPVDTVKLDRSFIADLATPGGGHTPDILGSVTSLAHALGKTVVAEGVESQQQHEHLVRLGCDLAQGYLYGRPVPASPFAARTPSPTHAPGTAPPPAPTSDAGRAAGGADAT